MEPRQSPATQSPGAATLDPRAVTTPPESPLPGFFHPVIKSWFAKRFPQGPTPAQSKGWPAIAQGRHTLIAAPTGSGKTLAAFLVHINRFYLEASNRQNAAPPGQAPGSTPQETNSQESPIQVVYVSPLKALVTDIAENLERPLEEMAELAAVLGHRVPELRVGIRTGDSTSSQRTSLLKHPPQILVTTPESLYLLVTAEKSRQLLGHVESIIVDEIHALARDKRGVHLALTLERLSALCKKRPARIGLSATQRPLPKIAQLLVGTSDGSSPECRIIDEGHQRKLDLALALPDRELEAVSSTEQLSELMDEVEQQIQQHRTTLVFVNTRRLSERLAHMLRERLGDNAVAAHHGSLSKERRLNVEQRLRNGDLKALVATASLELGIDIGQVELVCQIGSPRSIATFLQRVGRSGHTRFATPKARLYPLTRDELVECTALLRAVHAGRLDQVVMPVAPLDILAQQIVAECGAQTWSERDLFHMLTRASPYASLSWAQYQEVVDLLSEGIETGRGKRAAFLHRDRVNETIKGRRSARLSALTSGGAIPELADYRVIEEPGETFVGTINEDFAMESMAGDVFLLGTTSWRIKRVSMGTVRVVNAQGALPSIPFWLGEAPARTFELSEEVSALRAEIDAQLERDEDVLSWLSEQARIETDPAKALVDYLKAARAALGLLPTQKDLVFERFFDESGGMQVVVHSPFGGRINRGLGLLMRKRFCRSFDFELQAAANDDSIVLSLGSQHSFALEELRDFLSPSGVQQALTHAVLVTPMFSARWRWNLNRALIVLRFKAGKKTPPQFQRMEADDVMASVFPSLAACQDNATGPREIPDHPIVRQTLDDCMTEAMDLEGLSRLLEDVQSGNVQVHFRDTTEASPLSHEILTGRPYTFLDDAPLEERRTHAVQLRRGLPLEARNLTALDPEAVLQVREEAKANPRDAEELHDLLSEWVICRPTPHWATHYEVLEQSGRAATVCVPGGEFWYVAETQAQVLTLFPNAKLKPSIKRLPAPGKPREAVIGGLLRARLEHSGPTTAAQLTQQTSLPQTEILQGLRQLEADGFVLRGNFDSALEPLQYCSRRLLSRIHAYTQSRLRRQIEPVSAQDYMRFLLDFHGITATSRRRGTGGVLHAIEQLQGFESAAIAWEERLLPARVKAYRTEDLDALCWSGDVVWGRLSLRKTLRDQDWANFGMLTPITLATREDFPWLLLSTREAESQAPSPKAQINVVPQVLKEMGALFFPELLQATGLSQDDLEEALWDNVARGLITSDGFSALRTLLRRKAASRRPSLRQYSHRGLRRGARQVRPREGRWALLQQPLTDVDQEQLAEAVAEQLLQRYGVVFRDVLTRESFAVPWREVLWALRRLEARGQIRCGRFVGGFVGEQFALPEAVEWLREVRRAPPTGEVVELSACDPLNLAGIVLPGPKLAVHPKKTFQLKDGLLVDQPHAKQTA